MRVGTILVILSKCAPRQHANSTRWSGVYLCQLGTWPQSHKWVFYDNMLKDTCQAHELDSQLLRA